MAQGAWNQSLGFSVGWGAGCARGRERRRFHPVPSRTGSCPAPAPESTARATAWEARPPRARPGPQPSLARTARGGAAAARWAHNPKVAGSNPAPATSRALGKHPKALFSVFNWFGCSCATGRSGWAMKLALNASPWGPLPRRRRPRRAVGTPYRAVVRHRDEHSEVMQTHRGQCERRPRRHPCVRRACCQLTKGRTRSSACRV
jgi:hypothetical protein